MRSIPLLRSLGLAILFPVAVLAADPVAELAKFSVFGTVTLPELAKGEIKTGQGTPMSTRAFSIGRKLFRCSEPARESDRRDEAIRSDGAPRLESISPFRSPGRTFRCGFFQA